MASFRQDTSKETVPRQNENFERRSIEYVKNWNSRFGSSIVSAPKQMQMGQEGAQHFHIQEVGLFKEGQGTENTIGGMLAAENTAARSSSL